MLFTNKSLYKHILDLDSLNSARPVGVLIELRGVKGFGALLSMLELAKIEGGRSYWCPT
jgi:hypothetical protein